jgi:hypothetical protein
MKKLLFICLFVLYSIVGTSQLYRIYGKSLTTFVDSTEFSDPVPAGGTVTIGNGWISLYDGEDRFNFSIKSFMGHDCSDGMCAFIYDASIYETEIIIILISDGRTYISVTFVVDNDWCVMYYITDKQESKFQEFDI